MKRIICSLSVAVVVIFSFMTDALAMRGTGPTRGNPARVHLARFEGRWIDLSRSWGVAKACLVYPHRSTECFRTERALRQRVAALGAPGVSCSSPLVLHDGTYQTGTSVSVYARGLWIDLSTVGFNNKTSSYKVGACAVELASGSGGGGVHYTRCLSAGCVENVMDVGWNNVVSSVYLH
jgi:hypothetical protein